MPVWTGLNEASEYRNTYPIVVGNILSTADPELFKNGEVKLSTGERAFLLLFLCS